MYFFVIYLHLQKQQNDLVYSVGFAAWIPLYARQRQVDDSTDEHYKK